MPPSLDLPEDQPSSDPIGMLAGLRGATATPEQQQATQQEILANVSGANSPPPIPGFSPPAAAQQPHQGTGARIGGALKQMLSNYVQGMAASLSGEPSPYEQQQITFQNQLKQRQVAADETRANSEAAYQQAQAQANAPVPLIDLNGKPLIGPDGKTITLPGARAGQWYSALELSGARRDVAQTQANPRLAALGLNPDGTPKDESQLSPIQRQNLAASRALTEYNQAKSELAQMQGDPNSPVFQLKQQEVLGKLNALKASLGIRQAEFSAKYGSPADAGNIQLLSPAAQNVLMTSEPTHDQIKQLIGIFEPMKDDNTPGKFAGQRALYSMGIQSDVGGASDAIAQLELNKIAGAARVLKGSSRAIQALQMAMTHLPNVWIDSPKMIYSKLANLDTALEQIKQEAYTYGRKGGIVPSANSDNQKPTHIWKGPGQIVAVPANR